MPKRLQNPRLAKIHRSYRIDEIADLYRVGKNTVRNWIKQGLPICDNKRPMLILGKALNTFHAERRNKNKHPCKANEIYCVSCRSPKIPHPDMVEFQFRNERLCNLAAVCPDCDCMIYKRVSIKNINQVAIDMNITLPLAYSHIVESL